ncbi:hypothetical protein IKF03_02685 [Candidatus Saccharibacteria bacterium]|nr:hypothetical protein [Candidatus Saccharibacteria bacterium]
MRLKTLTAKQLKIGIKNGLNLESFCRECDCSEEEFTDKIKSLYNYSKKNAEDILKQIAKNDKKCRDRRFKPVMVKTEVVMPVVAQAAPKQQPVPHPVDELKALKATEKRQSGEVIKLESRHKALMTQHRQNIAGLRALMDEINSIRSSFEQKCEKYEEIAKLDNKIVRQMNEISEIRREKVKELEETRQLILDNMTINICVYQDGTITTLDEREIVFDESGSDELYQKLLETKECEDLRVKDIKILARLMKAVEHLNAKAEVICDDQKLEAVYKILSNLKTTST